MEQTIDRSDGVLLVRGVLDVLSRSDKTVPACASCNSYKEERGCISV